MDSVVDNLLDILLELDDKNQELNEIINILSVEGNENYFLLNPITKLKITIVKALGGNEANFHYLQEAEGDPFDKFCNEEIGREELLAAIKVVVQSDSRMEDDIFN